MTPDAAGRPERIEQPLYRKATYEEWTAAWWKMRERTLAAESELTRLRAEVEAAIARLDKAEKGMRDENLWDYGLKSVHVMPVQAVIEETRALLAARKED